MGVLGQTLYLSGSGSGEYINLDAASTKFQTLNTSLNVFDDWTQSLIDSVNKNIEIKTI